MDGFEATRKIMRMKEEGFVDEDLPIIALTANAMEGDREKCLEVGMDDYLSKPVRSKDLLDKVIAWTDPKPEETLAESEETSLPPKPEPKNQKHSADIKEVEVKEVKAVKEVKETKKAKPTAVKDTADTNDNSLTQVQPAYNDNEFIDNDAVQASKNIFKTKYDTILDYFIEDAETYLHQMQEAVKQKKPDDIIRPAHTLKSTSKRMGAIKLSIAAYDMEEKAKAYTDSFNPFEWKVFEDKISEMIFIFETTKSHFYDERSAKKN